MVRQRVVMWTLRDSTILYSYYAKDAHGSISHNYTHCSESGVFIALYYLKTRKVEQLMQTIIKGVIL